MSAKDEMLEYLLKESTVDMKLVHKCIAAVQLEAVEKAFSLRPLSLCVNYDESITAYMHKLKKEAGK